MRRLSAWSGQAPHGGGAWARFAVLGLLAPASVAARPSSIEVAVVRVLSPASIKGTYEAWFATFSPTATPVGSLAAWAPPDDPMGCHPYLLPDHLPGDRPGVVVVRRGNCTFLKKAELAQQAGAEGLIVVSDSETLIMGNNGTNDADDNVKIMVVGVPKAFGDMILAQHSSEPAMMTFQLYTRNPFDIAEMLIVCLGTALVAAGAYFSTSDLSTRGTFQQAVAAPQEEVMEVDYWLAIGFFIFGSVFLVVLYFFMKYMIYFIFFSFCMGGFNTLTQIGSIFLKWCFPQLKTKACTVPQVGTITLADLLASVPAAASVISWLFLRNTPYGWPFQDIIGAGFLCWLQRTMRLPNIKVASLFLCIMFCFDIFWVFLSPLLFQGHSVMVTVATGGGTGESVPMLLRIPAIGDPFGGNDRLLGFGDIALPGLLVSYLRRHDMQSERGLCEGYFAPALVGYFVGLCTTIVALMIMSMGQPALLYLVPGTLGTTVVRACCKGELGALWEGRPCHPDDKAGGLRAGSSQSESASTCCSGNDGL